MNYRFEELKQNYLPRFWDTEKKEMIYPDWFDYSNDIVYWYDKSTENDPCDDWDSMCLSDMLMNNRFIRMKPTGLKDKNGNLIYEGDVLCIKNYKACCCKSCKPQDYKAISFWCKDNLGFYFKSTEEQKSGHYKGSILYFNPRFTACEVIGNIHENPELLDKAK